MQWNNHYRLRDTHAFLSASQWHWLRDDKEKLIKRYKSFLAVKEGDKLHKLAKALIDAGIYVADNKHTFGMYVNDSIRLGMDAEVLLYYSDNCYGTADSILYLPGFLEIHDLKTGRIPAHMEQLKIYAALFCLEYHVDPENLEIRLRIYQHSEIISEDPDPSEIRAIMDKIVESDEIIDELKNENLIKEGA